MITDEAELQHHQKLEKLCISTRTGKIDEMVAIARHLNVTLIVPKLYKTSLWNDPRIPHYVFSSKNIAFYDYRLNF
ncbi:hypothetical protein RIF29_09969 [Crotalaria pallida]|uniref:O-fucosyltransferase family protein n=1 Tax=Crotalaria pallida TaxID=3830 RepID=A0AAN9FYK1_CROPI